VVLILNTRRKIKGHYFVSIGTLDTILCQPREVFRLAIMASAASIIIMHNLCAATHKLYYVERRFMWS
jgi:DNA repair protein RadC